MDTSNCSGRLVYLLFSNGGSALHAMSYVRATSSALDGGSGSSAAIVVKRNFHSQNLFFLFSVERSEVSIWENGGILCSGFPVHHKVQPVRRLTLGNSNSSGK